METLIPSTTIVGEVEAGRPTKVRKQINSIIKGVNSSTFDLAELLQEAKSKGYFNQWGFNTFTDYAKELELKITKSYYLVRIIENMKAAGIPREQYENVGITKLRVISKLDPTATYEEKPMVEFIKELVGKAPTMDMEDLRGVVAHLQGLTGDEAIVWFNAGVKVMALKQVIRPALDLAKANIGSVGKDDEGNSKDASDGAALEKVCLDFLSDPNNAYNTDELNKDAS